MRAASLLVKRDKIMDLHSSGSVSHKFGPLSLIIFLGKETQHGWWFLTNAPKPAIKHQ